MISSVPSLAYEVLSGVTFEQVLMMPFLPMTMSMEAGRIIAEMTPDLIEFYSMIEKIQFGRADLLTEGEREKLELFSTIMTEVMNAVIEELGSQAPAEIVGRIAGYLAYEFTVSAIMSGIGSLAATPAAGIAFLVARSQMVMAKLAKFGNWGLKISKALEKGMLLAKIQTNLVLSGKIVANTTKGWKVGDPINNLTKAGRVPAWSTVRQRFWKNEAFFNAEKYSPENLERMRRGLAPQRTNPITGKIESMELHHTPPQRNGGMFNIVPLWPDQHSLVDPFRILGG
jgi:hypothetical protein